MTSRTSYWVGLLLCAATAVSGIQLFASAQADTLKITGPNGEVKQANRQYGPTTSADTFWSIAQKVRPNDQVTIYQVMAALFDANPQAFSGNNFNTLERGMILTVPSAEVMASISKEQAKLRAERDDSAVKPVVKQTPRPVVTPVKVEQAPVPEKPLQIIAQAPAKISQTEPLSAAKQSEIITLNNQLDNANNKTLMLTDELARAQDQLMATRSDNQILKQKLAELTQSIGRLEEDLQLSGEKQAQLIAENEALVIELEEANKPPVEQPTDFWRNLTSNTGLLIAAASLPILLIFGVIALIMRRRSSANTVAPVQTENKSASKTDLSRTDDENGDDLEDLAIHLDGDDEESIDDLLDLDSLEMQSDTDLVIDDDQMDMASEMFLTQAEDEIDVTPEVEEEDEGTSLDDLWAEAMEEQDSELEPLETDEDLDSLLAGLDDEEIDEASPAALEDDLDALLANLDGETDEVDAPAEMLQDDLDALLANLDGETDATAPAVPEDDLDALLANLDAEPESSSVEDPLAEQQDNIDELLAGFDLPDEDASNETASELETKNDVNNSIVDENTADEDDIDSLLASFDLDNKTADKADLSAEIDNEDNDALLASFEADDAPAETEATQTEKETEDLTDAIAAELESDNEADVTEVNTDDDDIDALLASFEAEDAPAETEAEATETEIEDLANEIAAELESDDEVDANEVNTDDDDINALLASFEAEDAKTDQDADVVDELAINTAASTAEITSEAAETETEDMVDAIAAGSESDKGDVSLTEDEFLEFDELPENTPHLDSLLAELESATLQDEAEEFLSFDEDDELDDDDLSNLINELELANETTEQDDLSFDALESELNQAASAEVNSDKNLTKSDDIDDSILSDAENELDALLAGMSAEDETLNDELSNDAQELDFYESAFDNTSAQVNSPAEQVTAKAEKDSGFFNDLKAAKKAPADLLDWETDLFNPPVKPAAPTDNLIDNSKDFLVDDEDVDFSVNDDIDFNIDEDEFVLSDDGLTVDEAIAALDAKESKLASPHITEAELSNFERENGFIDINKLLNDADEDDSVASDRYKEIDVDMGEFESLIGNADMIDVDDEENSVSAKLDLARAYIEIDDEDNAKALLKEVQANGNDRQQAEASSLMKKLT